jgi:hypothetical protein
MSEIKSERSAPLKIQWQQGYYAFTRGWLANQYNPISVAGKEWQRGFDRGYFDNLEKLNGNQAVR